MGYSLARKTFTQNGQRTTLVALMLRGGGYRRRVGQQPAHRRHQRPLRLHDAGGGGVCRPARPIWRRLEAEGDAGRRQALGGRLQPRRGCGEPAAAKALNSTCRSWKRRTVFVYTFATPAALTAADQPDLQQDFDNNHDCRRRAADDWAESNIFNIISSGDIVPRVLPEDWGYHRNGNDRFLPATGNQDELADLDALGASYGPVPLRSASLAAAEDTNAVIDGGGEVLRRPGRFPPRSTKPP